MSVYDGPKISTNGLVLALDAGNRFSYVSGSTTWNDISNNNNNGTLTNGPTFSSANGGSIVFDGADDRVQLSNALITGTGDFTVSAWVKRSIINTNDFIMGNYGIGNNGMELYYYSQNTIIFYATNVYIFSIVAVTDTNWHFICATKNSGVGNIYFDGVLNKTQAMNVNIPGNNPFTLGNGYDYTNEALNGNIAIAQVYNRALTDQEVLQNYNATKTRFGL
jgi:hypothetical protein